MSNTKSLPIPLHPDWVRLEINDHFVDNWSWGENPYFEWCAEHCVNRYSINKYKRHSVTAHFENPKDATAFALRWS